MKTETITVTLTHDEAQLAGSCIVGAPLDMQRDTVRREILRKMQEAATPEPKLETVKKEKAS